MPIFNPVMCQLPTFKVSQLVYKEVFLFCLGDVHDVLDGGLVEIMWGVDPQRDSGLIYDKIDL